MKARRMAAIVVPSLRTAERSSWAVGVLKGWVVVQRELVCPVSWKVVAAVDMRTKGIQGGWIAGWGDQEEVIRESSSAIFYEEVSAWHLDPEQFPDFNDFDLSQSWFETEYFDMVSDALDEPLIKSE